MSRWVSHYALVLAGCACACGRQSTVPAVEGSDRVRTVDAGAPTPLVDHGTWTPAPLVSDAFADHRPANVDCPRASYGIEDAAFEVETGFCNYADLQQPMLVPLATGDTLHGVLLHAELVVPEPATAHVAVSVGAQVLWERFIDLPAPSQVYDFTVAVPKDLERGLPVRLHLHNHGYNTWTLLTLERL